MGRVGRGSADKPVALHRADLAILVGQAAQLPGAGLRELHGGGDHLAAAQKPLLDQLLRGALRARVLGELGQSGDGIDAR